MSLQCLLSALPCQRLCPRSTSQLSVLDVPPVTLNSSKASTQNTLIGISLSNTTSNLNRHISSNLAFIIVRALLELSKFVSLTLIYIYHSIAHKPAVIKLSFFCHFIDRPLRNITSKCQCSIWSQLFPIKGNVHGAPVKCLFLTFHTYHLIALSLVHKTLYFLRSFIGPSLPIITSNFCPNILPHLVFITVRALLEPSKFVTLYIYHSISHKPAVIQPSFLCHFIDRPFISINFMSLARRI